MADSRHPASERGTGSRRQQRRHPPGRAPSRRRPPALQHERLGLVPKPTIPGQKQDPADLVPPWKRQFEIHHSDDDDGLDFGDTEKNRDDADEDLDETEKEAKIRSQLNMAHEGFYNNFDDAALFDDEDLM